MAEIATFSGGAKKLDDKTEMERQVAALLVHVGLRVRASRERKGISRRVLSEMSGVSPRYLAQLESGEGNISIGLLKRVAHALDHKIEWFVGAEDPWTSEKMRVAEMFATADKHRQQLVLSALNPLPTEANKAERVCLIGLRGAGKSTLGRMAAERLDVPFLELNKEIALYGGMPIDEIMALYGQEGYRKLEASSLDRVIENYDRMILAVAGGIVAEPETFRKLLSRFHTIWIKASPQEHMNRVQAQGDERPMAGNADAMEQLRSILKSREGLYAKADAQLDTTGTPLETSLEQLLELTKMCGFFA
ncbi:helix-turn-helix transcriptional regulator [uncultured Ruegeria sp.]|uniref:helix-turn-helix transcriptional regulator n=1 Tax=uncultured Ruegeria sp. TaxID=259304 RepID=UPI002616AAB1|nr:helix-turn-helix transcriptional regulator [uncultured Ruegeria sp.]